MEEPYEMIRAIIYATPIIIIGVILLMVWGFCKELAKLLGLVK